MDDLEGRSQLKTVYSDTGGLPGEEVFLCTAG